jgi:hypothetical protein
MRMLVRTFLFRRNFQIIHSVLLEHDLFKYRPRWAIRQPPFRNLEYFNFDKL